MLLQAIINNQLTSFPGLPAKAITCYLDDSPAINKGHMKHLIQSICSARTTQQCLDGMKSLPILDMVNHMFCTVFLWDNKNSTIYTFFTEKFPVQSLDGHQCIFVLYDWAPYAILVKLMKDAKYKCVVMVLTKLIKCWNTDGIHLSLTLWTMWYQPPSKHFWTANISAFNLLNHTTTR